MARERVADQVFFQDTVEKKNQNDDIKNDGENSIISILSLKEKLLSDMCNYRFVVDNLTDYATKCKEAIEQRLMGNELSHVLPEVMNFYRLFCGEKESFNGKELNIEEKPQDCFTIYETINRHISEYIEEINQMWLWNKY